MARKIKTTKTRKTAGRGSILGLPIEGVDHRTPRTEIKDLIDEAKKTIKANRPKIDRTYQGKAVPATKVLRRRLDAFKNCVAFAWCIINETANQVTYCNTYGQSVDGTAPRSSWNPEDYTYPIVAKVVAQKLEQYTEVEADEWPSFVTPAGPVKKSRKSK